MMIPLKTMMTAKRKQSVIYIIREYNNNSNNVDIFTRMYIHDMIIIGLVHLFMRSYLPDVFLAKHIHVYIVDE